MKLYLYCLSDQLSADTIEGIRGVVAAPVMMVAHMGIRAIVSRINGERPSASRENIMAHQAVIGQVLSHTTPLPFRFGTIAAPSELEKYVVSERERLDALLARVRGAVEMDVKVIWNEDTVASDVKPPLSASNCEKQVSGPGRAFLLARQREMAASEALKKRAEEIAEWIEETVRELVRESSACVRPEESLVIRCAHLVDRASVASYRARLMRALERSNDLRFLTSGPWPPYTFTRLSQ